MISGGQGYGGVYSQVPTKETSQPSRGKKMIFIMLTRLIGKEIHPENLFLEKLDQDIEKKVAALCPDVQWASHYALFGPHDYLDIFYAPDLENAMKVGTIVRSFGHASVEIWPALEWEAFKQTIASLPDEKSFAD